MSCKNSIELDKLKYKNYDLSIENADNGHNDLFKVFVNLNEGR